MTADNLALGDGSPVSFRGLAVPMVGIFGLFLVLVLFAGIHFLGSDDVTYWAGGQGWLHHFPFIGTLGSNRETIAIPLAVSSLILGDNLAALALPTFLYSAGLIMLLMVWCNEVAGSNAALLTGLLLATCPAIVLGSGMASVDIIEAFFDFASAYMFYRAITNDSSWRILLGSGVLLGFGVLTRETTAYFAAAYAMMFLAGCGIPRKWFWVIALGCVCVIGAEIVFYWAATGDPLYRINNSFHHDSTINRLLNQGDGLPLMNPFLDPFILLAFGHYFGALFWIAIPLGIWLLRNRRQGIGSASAVRLIGGVSLVWFVLAGLSFKLLPLMPRYFTISVVGGCMIAALGLARLWSGGRPVLAGGLLALLLLCNAGGLLVENRNYMFGEWELLDVASRNAGVIHTDPLTLRRAKLLLQWHGLDDRVTADPAKSGDLFLWNPPRAGRDYAPQPSWTRLEDFQPKVPLARRLLQDVPDRLLPAELRNKFGAGHPDVVLYKVQ